MRATAGLQNADQPGPRRVTATGHHSSAHVLQRSYHSPSHNTTVETPTSVLEHLTVKLSQALPQQTQQNLPDNRNDTINTPSFNSSATFESQFHIRSNTDVAPSTGTQSRNRRILLGIEASGGPRIDFRKIEMVFAFHPSKAGPWQPAEGFKLAKFNRVTLYFPISSKSL